jgi:hypothetical protein
MGAAVAAPIDIKNHASIQQRNRAMDGWVCMEADYRFIQDESIDLGQLLTTETRAPVKPSNLHYGSCMKRCIVLMMLAWYAAPEGILSGYRVPWKV